MNHIEYIYNVICMIVSRILVFFAGFFLKSILLRLSDLACHRHASERASHYTAYAISKERLLVSGSIVLWLKTETAT